jgi:predicted dehydrogenase/threonine dehydrogenase-like Zn-dependent dehydrogenase
MKQVLQSLKSGKTILEDVPCPQNTPGTLLIETTTSLVSAGTERMLLEFGKANLLGKIRQQPDKVKMVLDKIKTDGLLTTLNAVKNKLDQPIPLGYCNVGKILEVGENVVGFTKGDRVISNGYHAEIVRVPKNCCAKIPDNVTDEMAAFTVLSAIALQGIRLSQPTLGESYVVIGLGLIGLLTVQILRANGCRVLGVDFDESKCELAKKFGAEIVDLSKKQDLITQAFIFSRERGVDAVIITAATASNELLHEAALICRKRARIILIGVIGNEFSRADFYEKELSFQVSCSYGPGRYDDMYEKLGLDYPVGFVRWTQQRNFEAVLDMMSMGVLDVKSLISERFTIDNISNAYQVLEKNKSVLGILIEYLDNNIIQKTKTAIILDKKIDKNSETISVGFLGSGNYGANILAPAFQKSGVHLHTVISSQGISGKRLAKKLGFHQAATDENAVFLDDNIHMAVIATQHNMHANQVIYALQKNKHVFVEKPLAINLVDLEKINATYQQNKNNLLMIGFNRRFSPLIQTIKKLLTAEVTPKTFMMTVNAGAIPKTHWTQDLAIGGGRIVGEACHFIDLFRFLAGFPITDWQAIPMRNADGSATDSVIITLTFSDGSCGSIHYLTNGHKAYPKEKLEVFCNGKILQCDNFRQLTGFGWKHFKKQKCRKQNKGQVECVQAFVDAVKQGKSSPIPFSEIMEVAKITIEISEHLRC